MVGYAVPLRWLCANRVLSRDRYKFSLSYHHFNRLRCDDKLPWSGDAILSKAGSEQFIAWFSAQGYEGFAQFKAWVDDYIAKRHGEYTELLALFPAETRELFPERDHNMLHASRKNAQALAAAFSDQTEFVHTCWRALGQQAEWSENTSHFFVHREPASFLRAALELADQNGARAALDRLTPADAQAWLGATLHLLQPYGETRWRDVMTPADYARLAEPYMRGPGFERLIEKLDKHPAPETFRLLLQVIDSYDAKPSKLVPSQKHDLSSPTPLAAAALSLGRHRHFPVRTALLSKLATVPQGEDRLALEVALAHLEGPSNIRAEHIQCRVGEISEAAWNLAIDGGQTEPKLELVLAAVRSGSYEVRRAAAEILRKHGVRPIKDEEVPSSSKLDPELTGQALIDACTAVLEDESLAADPLLLRRGQAYLELGDYAAARRDLQLLYDPLHDPQKLLLACLALGRFGDALSAANSMARTKSASAARTSSAYLTGRALCAYARGDFETAAEEFGAARQLGCRPFIIALEHLALAHLGEAARSPLRDWEPGIGGYMLLGPNREPGFDDALLLFLQRKLPEKTLLSIAQAPDLPQVEAVNLCEAHFLLAELARIVGDAAGEREHLERSLAKGAFASEAHVLAHVRAQELTESGQ